MRIMSMHKTQPRWEADIPPDPEMVAGMGMLMGKMAQAGVLLAGEGLRASSRGVRLKFSDGNRTMIPGPFAPSNELIAGFAIVRVHSMDEAVAWATRFAEAVGDVEIDIRPVTEPWDIGIGAKPEGLTTTRYMLAHKADRNSEAGVPPSQQTMAAMGKLIEDMTRDGVLLLAEGLQPSSKGLRLKFSNGKRSVTDGPFTESKELIAGFVILQVQSMAEAIEWAAPFAALVGDVEMDFRPLQETTDRA